MRIKAAASRRSLSLNSKVAMPWWGMGRLERAGENKVRKALSVAKIKGVKGIH
jgi:hypothetical protein